jgi:hypothetical protein
LAEAHLARTAKEERARAAYAARYTGLAEAYAAEQVSAGR